MMNRLRQAESDALTWAIRSSFGLRSDAAAASSAARSAGSIRTASCSLLLACFAMSASVARLTLNSNAPRLHAPARSDLIAAATTGRTPR